jgi:hypothetical protein
MMKALKNKGLCLTDQARAECEAEAEQLRKLLAASGLPKLVRQRDYMRWKRQADRVLKRAKGPRRDLLFDCRLPFSSAAVLSAGDGARVVPRPDRASRQLHRNWHGVPQLCPC